MITAMLNKSGTSMSLFDVDEYVGLVIKLGPKRYFALQSGPQSKNGPIVESPDEALKWFLSVTNRTAKTVKVDFAELEANSVTHPKKPAPVVKKKQYDWSDTAPAPVKPKPKSQAPRPAVVVPVPQPKKEQTLEEALAESTRLAKEAFNA